MTTAITAFNLDLLTVGVAGAAIALMGLFVFLSNTTSSTNRNFLLFAFLTIVWNFTNFIQYKFLTGATTLWALRINLFVAVWHAFSFFQLAYVFPGLTTKFPFWYKRILFPVVVLTSLLTLTPFVFSGISHLAPPGEVTNPERGWGIVVFSIVAFGLLLLGIFILLRRISQQKGLQRLQTAYFFMGMLITAILILFFNLILPVVFNTLTFLPYAALFMSPFIALVSYSIFRLRLFNLKVAFAGFLVFLLAALSFVEVVFTNTTPLLLFRGAILLLTVGIGIQLVRSVIREVEQREHIEQLAGDLRVANERLKELDKLKSQFLSIASHDLRAPLTVIRNFMSLMLDGTYGKIPEAAGEGMRQVFDRATDMAKSVDTYLNVSRIQQGRMKYDFINVELSPLIEKAVKDFAPNAEKKGLSVSFTADPDLKGKKAKVDVVKMNEVLNNLLDNSIKYTPKGSITVKLEKVPAGARFTVSDTGIGMTQETIGKLFKLFSTGENSLKVNISSTGVGLYITKAHVEAHGGKIWAESDGEGKGSRFIMELPLLP